MSAQNNHAAKAARREARATHKVQVSTPTKLSSNRSELRKWMKEQKKEHAKEQRAEWRSVHQGRITTNVKVEETED